jgi:predicted phage-related endonuclease
MKILTMQQRSPEWHAARVGSIGGTGFGQVISGKKNRLIYNLINERLNGYATQDDYVSEDMQFGIDNEPIARELYSQKTGIEFREVGLIKSDYSDIHHASPDGISPDNSIVLECKCTDDGAIQLQRFFEGVETSHMPQIINYFAVSDEVKEVHWISYCPYREERPLVIYTFKAEFYQDDIAKARTKIKAIEAEIEKKIQEFTF